MKSAKKWIGFLCLAALLVYMVTLVQDRQALRDGLIRLHVVADSDTEHDQAVKLQVRDAVVAFVEENLVNAKTAQEAGQLLSQLLPQIQALADETLKSLGEHKRATVSFLEEAFPTRDYNSFSLPAGVYKSLRITIGEGQGKNWWCVVFPNLCTGTDVQDTAVGAGFSRPLADTVTGEGGYELRFFFLELLGKLENLLKK